MSEESKTTEIVKTEPQELTLKQVEAIVEQKIFQDKAVMNVVNRSLEPYFFERWKGSVRLNVKGAQEIASICGITITYGEGKRKEIGEGHYQWTYPTTAIRGTRENDADGVCNSKDKFFGTNPREEWVNGKKTGKWKESRPLGAVDESKIILKSQTNGRVNAISRMFNLHSLPPFEFEQRTGIQIEDVKYAHSGKDEDLEMKKLGQGPWAGQKQIESKPEAKQIASKPRQVNKKVTATKEVEKAELLKHNLESMPWEAILLEFVGEAAKYQKKFKADAYKKFLGKSYPNIELFLNTREMEGKKSRRKLFINAFINMIKELDS